MDFYPRPQFVRKKWQDLDGTWAFDFDDKKEGIVNEWFHSHNYSRKIKVPFTYQSQESGINIQEIHDCVWYGKEMNLEAFDEKLLYIHFGASDYHTKVWVNGHFCGEHKGGHTPFSFEISNYISDDYKLEIAVCVVDYSMDTNLPRGKQTFTGNSEGIFYTGTTGIWQSVWLEFVNENHIESVRYTPDTLNNEISISTKLKISDSATLITKIYRQGEIIVENSAKVYGEEYKVTYEIPDFNDHHYGYWWSPETPNLYDVQFQLLRDNVETDYVESYFGMRSTSVEEGFVCLNHLPFYTKAVLYQGYYPNSLMTAKNDAEIKRDVELIKQMGFNAVRLHQKYENPRFLYWCDQLGLVVWGEAPNAYSFSNKSAKGLMTEWMEAIERDYNHPSICVWIPLNESWGIPKIKESSEQQAFATAMYSITKSLDRTRLVISNDGWEHTISDICTIHDYEADLNILKNRYQSYEEILKGPQKRGIYVGGYQYQQEPMILSEFGGIAYDVSNTYDAAWGYSGAATQEEFEEKVIAMIEEIQQSPLLQGYCYTQFNDLEQEVNGLLTMDREPKLDLTILAKTNERKS